MLLEDIQKWVTVGIGENMCSFVCFISQHIFYFFSIIFVLFFHFSFSVYYNVGQGYGICGDIVEHPSLGNCL